MGLILLCWLFGGYNGCTVHYAGCMVVVIASKYIVLVVCFFVEVVMVVQYIVLVAWCMYSKLCQLSGGREVCHGYTIIIIMLVAWWL